MIGRGNNSVDSLRTLAATSFASSAGALMFNTMPIILGVLAETKGFEEGTLASLAAAILVGAFVAVTSAVFWIDKVAWRPVLVLTAMVCLVASCLIPYTNSVANIAVLLALIGFLLGVIYAPTLAALGQASNPPRAFAISIVVQVIISAIVAYILPAYLSPKFGSGALTVVVAVCCLVVTLSYPALPTNQKTAPEEGKTAAPDAIVGATQQKNGILSLAAMGIFYIGLMGVWDFLERVGVSWSITPVYIGGVIALALILGGLGALFAAVIGERAGQVRPVVMAFGFFAIAATLLGFGSGALQFATAVILFNIGWNLSLPFLYAILSSADQSGRLIVLAPAVQTLGAVLGSLIAGQIVLGIGFNGLYGFFIICALLMLAIHIRVSQTLGGRLSPGV